MAVPARRGSWSVRSLPHARQRAQEKEGVGRRQLHLGWRCLGLGESIGGWLESWGVERGTRSVAELES